MKVSLEWIRDLLPDLKAAPAAIERRLNLSGVEVASTFRPQAALAGVVVGEVRKVEPHPSADRLRVTQVFDGDRTHQVVCGAPNVDTGLRVPFAPVGTHLPNGMKIETRAIRGVESSGMLCAADELGLGVKSDGLFVLKPRLKAGRPLADVLKIKDTVFDLELTPNRADLLCHLGVARELAALFNLPLPVHKVKVKETGTPPSAKVKTEDSVGCPFYAARIIRGVQVGPSPFEVQQRLLALGQRPVSNVVDATNLVLLELGHPLHAFDLTKLEGRENVFIRARRAHPGERIDLLDGSTKVLSTEDLVIADGKGPVALAGVMGGRHSEVDEGTTDILLEAAYFDPRGVRRTAKRHGLHTEASHRFERGVDPHAVGAALDACAQLIEEWAAGTVAKGVTSSGHLPDAGALVPIRAERASTLLGRPVGRQEVRSHLRRLGLKAMAASGVKKSLLKGNEDALWFRVPSWRRDLHVEADLVEEVARLGGYEQIPTEMPDVPLPVRAHRLRPRTDAWVKSRLAGLGFQELLSLGFASPSDAAAFQVPASSLVRLKNPLGEETQYLRFSLLPALLQVARRNQDQLPSRTDLRLFEVGRAFRWSGATELPDEETRVGILMRGRRSLSLWGGDGATVDAFDLKGVIEHLGRFLPKLSVQAEELGFLHPRASGKLTVSVEASEVVWGAFGQVHPDLMAAYGLEGPPVFVAELSLDVLERGRKGQVFSSVSPHPPAQRDLSFWVDRSRPASAILETIRQAGRPFDLEDVHVFDVYEGEHAPPGQRSVAVALTYRAPNRTLTAQEVETAQARVVEALEKEQGAKLRG